MPNGTQKHTESSTASVSHDLGRSGAGAAGASGVSVVGRFSSASLVERGSSMRFFVSPEGRFYGDKYSENRREIASARAAFFSFCRNMLENARLLSLRGQLFGHGALPPGGKSPCAFPEKRSMIPGKALHVFGKSAGAFCVFPFRFPLTAPARRGIRLVGWLFLVFCASFCSYACLFLWSAFFSKTSSKE